MLGFGLGLRQLGFTSVQATFPEPFEVAEPCSVPARAGPAGARRPTRWPSPTWGSASTRPARAGSASCIPALTAAPEWIVLDHHVSNTGFGYAPAGRPGRGRDRRGLRRLLDELGVELDAAIATCLYVGLATDTGSFKFDATTPEVFALAARLVAGRGPAGRGGPAGLRHPAVRGDPAAGRGARPGRARPGRRRRSRAGLGLRDPGRPGPVRAAAARAGELHGRRPHRRGGRRGLPDQAGGRRAGGRCRCAARAPPTWPRSRSRSVAAVTGWRPVSPVSARSPTCWPRSGPHSPGRRRARASGLDVCSGGLSG